MKNKKKSVIFGDDLKGLEEARRLKDKLRPQVEMFFRKDDMAANIHRFLFDNEEVQATRNPPKTREYLFYAFVSMNGSRRYDHFEAKPAPEPCPSDVERVILELEAVRQAVNALSRHVEELRKLVGGPQA